MDGRPSNRNKDSFSNNYGVVWRKMPDIASVIRAAERKARDTWSQQTDIGKCVANFSTNCNYRARESCSKSEER